MIGRIRWPRRPERVGVAVLVLAVAAASFGCAARESRRSDEAGSTPPDPTPDSARSSAATSTEAADTLDSTDGDTGVGPTTSAETSTEAPDPAPPQPDVIGIESITALMDRSDELVGATVAVRAKAFFLEECPPPDQTDGGPCSLLLFVGDTDRDSLVYGERDLAVPGFEADRRVTCEVGPSTTTACEGWINGGVYDLVATVRPQQFGRRVDLHINNRKPA